MRLIGLVLSLLTVSFAGCIEEGQFVGVEGADTSGTDPAGNNTDDSAAPGNGTAPDGTGNGTVDDTGNQTAPNTPPVANLTADVLSGEAPLAVTFTIESSDADGDNLTWTLTVADAEVANGTGTTGVATHTFNDVGNHSVTLNVTDGSAWAQANLSIVVAGPANAGPVVDVTVPLLLPCSHCGDLGPATAAASFMIAAQGPTVSVNGLPLSRPDVAVVSLPAEARGQPYSITSTTDPDAFFASTCALINAQIEFVTDGGHLSAAAGPETGIVPADAACVWIWEFDLTTPLSTIHLVVG